MAGNQETWHDLGLINAEFNGKVFDTGTDEVWVFQEAGVFRAVSNICPHKMGPVSEGILKNGLIECPWHGYRFNIGSGVSAGKACPPLRIYETKTENGHLFVQEKKQ
mgnify:CR=1 FL=1